MEPQTHMTADEEDAVAVFTLFSTDVGPMPRRKREALLIIAGQIHRPAEELARIQRAIARFPR